MRMIECGAQEWCSGSGGRVGRVDVGNAFRIAGDEPVIALVETIHVLRAALQAGAARQVTDHATFL
jgi:hypothetical protein